MDKTEDASSSPALQVKAETIAWLKERLSAGPQRIASLIAEWCGGQLTQQPKGALIWEGGRDGMNGRWLVELMQARGVLGAVAYLDDNNCYCWRLPQSH
jgi:hypothetical protein